MLFLTHLFRCFQSIMDTKVVPFIKEKIQASLGEQDDDLNNFVIQHVKERASPDEIVEGLEAVSLGLIAL